LNSTQNTVETSTGQTDIGVDSFFKVGNESIVPQKELTQNPKVGQGLLEEIAGSVVFVPSLKTRPRRAGKPMPLTNGSIVAVCPRKAGCFLRGNSVFCCGKAERNLACLGRNKRKSLQSLDECMIAKSDF
jgi:hypothetical protein